ncbi:ATP-binding protein [Paenibacillus antri]|uniref:ATP-binding protein n=1 Tax=Paenibacillus antri TaxID=2582848 RepID=A0A5R9GAV2_9BACL|nr:YifB family Mg chelatase-like AAA ATPase [Paenibacillus antri]TLS49863.1 ATP-binding protein [Paenibacillus antri]
MYGTCYGACMHGIDGRTVTVEIDLANGLPAFSIVGLPDNAVRESTERVRAALKNGGFEFPMRRITVNLAPADVRKEGASFDLAIAVGILLASGQWPASVADGAMFLGELSLLGDVRPVPGVLSMALAAKDAGLARIVVPAENAREASLAGGIDVVPVARLRDVLDAALGVDYAGEQSRTADDRNAAAGDSDELDFSDVVGQMQSKRALAIAAAGRHNIVFIGPPGSGKTMLMRRLATILPPLEDDEALEVTKIYSASGQLADRGALVRRRPFRSPHHTISPQGLIGGGATPRPGEASLAHRGVLFLDELPEFPRTALESLRQPLEDGAVTIARARGAFTYPARFALAGTMNPCPCGYDGYEEGGRSCTCSLPRKLAYLSRLSGPLMDRIDMTMDVPRLRPEEAELRMREGEYGALGGPRWDTKSLIRLVDKARAAQRERYAGLGIRSNAELSGKLLHRFCRLGAEASGKLMRAYGALEFSARAHDRVLKVARTIADAEGSERIEPEHMNEALTYRALDFRRQRLRDGDMKEATSPAGGD